MDFEDETGDHHDTKDNRKEGGNGRVESDRKSRVNKKKNIRIFKLHAAYQHGKAEHNHEPDTEPVDFP